MCQGLCQPWRHRGSRRSYSHGASAWGLALFPILLRTDVFWDLPCARCFTRHCHSQEHSPWLHEAYSLEEGTDSDNRQNHHNKTRTNYLYNDNSEKDLGRALLDLRGAPLPPLFRAGVGLTLLEDNLATVITALEVWLSFHLISPLLGTDPKEIIE